MAITLAGIQWILISVSVSSNSLIIREGSTGELVIAKEVCILNIRLQLNLSKKKKWRRFVFTAHSFGVDDIGWNTYGQSEAKRRFRLSVNGQTSNFTELWIEMHTLSI